MCSMMATDDMNHLQNPDNDANQSPGEAIQVELTRRGWTHANLADRIGKHRSDVSALIVGTRSITPDWAVLLGTALGMDPAHWMHIQVRHDLALVDIDKVQEAHRLLRMHNLAPVRAMADRGWITRSKNPCEIENDLKRFFGINSLDDPVDLLVETRRRTNDLTPEQRAWCYRARQIARALKKVARFDPSKMDGLRQRLRQLAAYAKEARHVPELMGEFGIRFIVIEPLPGSKIDGAAFWLDEESPVIVVSLRYDRIDAFWFTLMHEYAHIYFGDKGSVDANLAGEDHEPAMLKDDIERRADESAGDWLVPVEELDSFVRRVSPLYAKPKIVQFAQRIKMHPSIILGQLQHRGEIAYSSLRDLMVKIRETVTSTAITDGWGNTISPDIL